jgi:hypothetical protein
MFKYKITVEELDAMEIGTVLYDSYLNARTTIVAKDSGYITTRAEEATKDERYPIVDSIDWLVLLTVTKSALKYCNESRVTLGLPEITQEELWPTPEDYQAYHFLQQIKDSNELPKD